MKDMTPYNEENESFITQFERMRPDTMLPAHWTPAQKNRVMELTKPSRTKTSMLSSIPMLCRGNKCHPAGTLIRTNLGQVPIEELNDKHLIIGYDVNNNAIRGGFRNGNIKGFDFSITKRSYSGWMINLITENGLSHQVTHDHISVIKWIDRADQSLFSVYLMQRGDTWRIGKAKMFTTSGNIGAINRARTEDADAVWILGVYDSNTTALLEEEYYSVNYGIPKACFTDSLDQRRKWDGLYSWVSQDELDMHHKRLMKPRSHFKSMLDELGLCIEHPFWSRIGDEGLLEANRNMRPSGRGHSASGFKYTTIRSCNILPELMEVGTYSDTYNDKTRNYKPEWVKVNLVKFLTYDLDVYSLDVDRYHTYFANDIITHNCEFANTCPLLKEDLAPINEACPLEVAMVGQFMAEYMDQLDVDEGNLVEVSMIRDLVDQEVQYIRKSKYLAKDSFIQENVIGIDNDGDPIMKKELHLAVELEDRLHRRRKDLFKQLLASREAKAKVGLGTLDSAQTIANIMSQVREIDLEKQKLLRARMGKEVHDDFIEADIVKDKD